MNFSLTEEQQLLADSLARFFERDYTFEKRRAIQKSPEGFGRDAWAQLAEMGIVALPLPADHGGFGGGAADMLPVMKALGAGLLTEPYLATAILGAGLIARAGTAEQKASVLPGVAEGKRVLALALRDAEGAAVKVAGDGKGWTLDGKKRVVLHGGQADTLVVVAAVGGGHAAFLVDRKTPGVTVRDYRTIDGLRGADVTLAGVKVAADSRVGGDADVTKALRATLDAGAAALCAEAVGVMEQLNTLTLDYIKTRQQFGQPIGRFQVLQHRAVDMFISAEQSKSMAYLAGMRAEAGDSAAVAGAARYVAREGRKVAKEAIQLHGGMGVTNELPAAHYAKRATMIGFWLDQLA
ncbi:MAG: acyl-CoA dehydrogenase [Burkholderiales bacterium]|jgi:alkylation response protein AidB-like acyl-CoA dehydrogenase|nr:acyl-CoA dehydrogenase [Burkholderiales bacterium]